MTEYRLGAVVSATLLVLSIYQTSDIVSHGLTTQEVVKLVLKTENDTIVSMYSSME